MTKKCISLFILFIYGALISLQAQNIFSKGDKAINVGIGLGSYYGGTGYTSNIPPISASFEQGVVDGLLDGKASIGVGGYLAYTSNKWETVMANNTYGYKYTYFILGARGAFHYQFIEKLDTYTGLMLGYNVVGSKTIGDSYAGLDSPTSSGFGYSAFIGGRYHFSEKFTAFAELGYGISALEIGISFRL